MNLLSEAESWKPYSFLGSQKIPLILRNLKVYYHSLVPILEQTNPGHALPTDFFKIHSNIILPSTSRSSIWSLFLRVPQS